VLDRHERRAHAEDDALDLVEELAAAFADGDDDADLVLGLGVQALVLQRLEQPSGMRAASTRTVLDISSPSVGFRIRNLPPNLPTRAAGQTR